MTRLKQANCPNCRTILRFKPTASEVVAITCTQCGNLFEVQVAASLPAATQPIKAMPVAVLPIAAQPVDSNQSSSAPMPVIPVKQTPSAKAAPMQATPVQGVTNGNVRQGTQRPAPTNVNANLDAELGSLSSPRQTPVYTPASNSRSTISSRPRPSAARLQTHNSLMMPLMIVLGLALVVFLGGFAFLASMPSGRSFLKSINPLTNSPERAASKLNNYIDQYVAILDEAQAGQDYSQAAEELRSLEHRITELAFVAAQFDTVDNARHETLMASIEIGNKRQFDSLETSRMLQAGSDAELSSEIADVTAAMNVVQDLVMKVIKEPSKPESTTDQVCLDGLLLERKILRCIASAKSTEEVGPMIDALHVLIDRFNELAEEQKKSGERVSFIPRDYEGLETGGQDARDWFLDYIQKNCSVPETFLPTVDDLKFVESRFDGALFKSEIDMLTTTSRERVQAAMKSDVAYRLPEAPDKSLATSGSPASSEVASSAPPSSMPPSSVPPSSVPPSSVLKASTGMQSSVNQNDGLAAARQHQADALTKQEEARIDVQQRSEEQRSELNSTTQNRNQLSGPNALTIKVFGGHDLNAEELSQRFKRKVGSSSSVVVANGDPIIMSFSYSGNLADVARHIDFGKIDLSDSQSRTIYVDAK